MRERKSYSKSFKAQVVHECQQPGVSVAAIAMSHGINANVVRRWLPLFRDQRAVVLPAFVPVNVAPANPKPKVQASVVIELPFGERTITVKWPASDPEGCAQFVRGFAL
ncbi:transposase [Pseudomonas protegens]|uniref:IS66-like element accessory protein TnpA n=1 Tax=Pseudomonas protegens TaxID=380021 RepID=UPI001C69AFBA|nr:transposase [Pseudomonas protegens]QYN03695.1 transposase [Pseudomonas protegens]